MRLSTKVKKLEEKINHNKLCAFIGVPQGTEDPMQAAEVYWDKIKLDHRKKNIEWVMPIPDSSFKAVDILCFTTLDEFRELMKANSKNNP